MTGDEFDAAGMLPMSWLHRFGFFYSGFLQLSPPFL
jgi:hypothetical protein